MSPFFLPLYPKITLISSYADSISLLILITFSRSRSSTPNIAFCMRRSQKTFQPSRRSDIPVYRSFSHFKTPPALRVPAILAVQTQPYLSLSGEDILVGFLDSGIDYTHPAFRNPDGTTRILGIWDQTDQSGTPPPGFLYGSSYTGEQINAALFSSSPGAIVPEADEEGHGTAVAGIACGSPDPESDFTGAAPRSSLLFVRLKPAKAYLRDYFLIPSDAIAYQENDLMLGVRYLMQTARSLAAPACNLFCTRLQSGRPHRKHTA